MVWQNIGNRSDGLRRMRRSRANPALRELVRETSIRTSDLIYPVFVKEHAGGPEEISSMPGIFRHPVDSLLRECEESIKAGLRAVAVFPCIPPGEKDDSGSVATRSENILLRAVSEIKANFPDLLVVADVALDPYTSHGHDGLLNAEGTDVDNDSTVRVLCDLAVAEARAGADIVAPSDMMDGRVRAIREALDAAGFTETLILSYAAKYASAYYGPFRDAIGSARDGTPISKTTYQMDPANSLEAELEVTLDLEEGADWVMIKPAGPYLDVIRRIASVSPVPVAAYQVSGEYAQIHAAARLGWLDYRATRDESLLAIRRAGARIILSYFALEIARESHNGDSRP